MLPPSGILLGPLRPRPMTDMTPSRVHRYDIDALRIMAAVMVLTIHVTSVFISIPERAGTQGAAYWMALLANLVSVSAVPVFFAISGWALMSRPRAADDCSSRQSPPQRQRLRPLPRHCR